MAILPPAQPLSGASTPAGEVSNIRDDLETALQDESINFNAAFSFNKTYTDAPNPTLELANVGLVGLPLSIRDAELIKSHSVQAPFGMGERTIVDTTVRDTWEMDAKQVTFSNPRWNAFVSKVLAEVCQTLGVNFRASQPRAELYKLLLYETGSHFLPHVDTEKADGMFATIVIVLPSQFTGGAAHLSHGEIPVVYDCSGTSKFDTTVLAWYTDVKHEIKPITSGYRLALSYNLIHTTQSLRPAIATNTSLVEKLTRVLLAWKNNEDTPEKLIYLLDHKYSQANLRASALKGADAQKAAILETLAERHGFGLGLANANCHISGAADDEGGGYYDGYYGRHRRRSYYDDWAAQDDENVEFGEIFERSMSIEHFVNLDGQLIAENLEYEEEDETIPLDLTDDVESGDHDEQEYEGYMGNGAGSLDRWYRRTVLIIWPDRNNYQILFPGEHGFDHACDKLAEEVSLDRPPEQTQLVEFIFTNHAFDRERAAETLCRAACDLEDLNMWIRAVELCAPYLGVSTIDDEYKQEAIETFGFEVVKPSLELMLKHDKHNSSRLEFLNTLAGEPWEPRMTHEEKVQELHALTKPWATARIQEVLKSLQKPTIAECSVLLKAARVHGGVNFLQDSLLPQLITLGDPQFLLEFAVKVFSDTELPECGDKTHVIPTLLTTVISKEIFYKVPPKPSGYPYHGYRQPAPPADSPDKAAKSAVQTCFQLECPQLVGTVIDRLMDISKLAPEEAQDCAKTVMLPLATYITEYLRTHPDIAPIPQIEALQTTATKLYLDCIEKNPNTLNKQEVTKLFDLCLASGDGASFVTSVVPRLKAMRLTDTARKVLVDELRGQRGRFKFPEGYTGQKLNSVILSFAQRYILATNPQQPAVIISIFDWISSIQIPDLYYIFIDHLTNPTKLNQTYVKTALVPLLPQLRVWAVQRGVLDKLAPAFQRIVAAWIDKVLGPPLAPNPTLAAQLTDLSKWTCSCQYCTPAKNFLTKNAEAYTTLYRIGAPNRRHVEQFLMRYARALATYNTILGSPQGLGIHKSETLQTFMKWRVEQSNGRTMLKTISSDDAELRRLLSTEYTRIALALQGSVPGPSQLPASSAPSSTRAVKQAAVVPSSSAASSSAVLPAPAVSAAAPSPSATVHPIPAAETRQENLPGQPPAKKRKMAPVNANDVIDLS